MSTYTKFSRLSLATKIRLREKFTSEYFTGENIPIYGTMWNAGTIRSSLQMMVCDHAVKVAIEAYA